MNTLGQIIMGVLKAYPLESTKPKDNVDRIRLIAQKIAIANQIKTSLIAYTLPPLVGSQAQITWAKHIRAKLLEKSIYALLDNPIAENQYPSFQQKLNKLFNHTDTTFWIEHRASSINDLLSD